MTALELLSMLRSLGVTLTPWGERLRVDAPTGVLTDDMQQAIRTHKAALIELVEEIEERACIGEFCGGLAREEAERLAWACVLGKVTV